MTTTRSLSLKSVTTTGDKVVAVHHAKAENQGRSLDSDETIEFSFSGDKLSRLDEWTADQAADEAFWG
jgi:ketosteroid isomerase-like protein